jgi:hypothetical protein
MRGRWIEHVHQLGRQPRVAADADAATQERAARVQFAGQDAVEHRAGNVHVEKTARWGDRVVVESQGQRASVVGLEEVGSKATARAGKVAVEPA